MPIYEYACHACGLEKEHLQKMSDPPIAQCPACGSTDYVKKVSAAGFQLKGTGWYVTDFRNKPQSGSKPKEESGKNPIMRIKQRSVQQVAARLQQRLPLHLRRQPLLQQINNTL